MIILHTGNETILLFLCREKSAVSHSITPRDTLKVSPVKIPGATAFETSGKLFSELSWADFSNLRYEW